jgi:hypothetical protein
VSLSLARTARWLLAQDGPSRSTGEQDGEAYRVQFGNGWSGIAPPGRVDGRNLAWPHLPPAYGAASPTFD